MTILPTPRLVVLVAAAAPMFLAGGLHDAFSAAGIVYLAIVSVYVLLDALFLPRRSQIILTRAVPNRVSIGVPTRVAFEIKNRTRREVEIRMADDLPARLEAIPSSCVARIRAREDCRLEYRLLATQRGRYLLSRADVRVLPRLGLLYRQFSVQLPATIHVFPNLVNVRRYELLLRRGMMLEQGVGRLRQIGQGTEFESLRQYTIGDDMSRVEWKATAKRSRLIVKNFEPERQQSVLIAIDVGRATAGEFNRMSRLDYLVNAALMLGYVALRQGDWFSLVAFSNRIESYLPPVRRIQGIDRVARALYELEPRLIESDYAVVSRFLTVRHRRRGLICLMTDVLDHEASADVISCLTSLARRQLPLAVTLSNPELRAVADEPLSRCADPYSKAVALDVLDSRRKALAAMRRQGVGVLDVEPPALTVELINRYLMIKSMRRL